MIKKLPLEFPETNFHKFITQQIQKYWKPEAGWRAFEVGGCNLEFNRSHRIFIGNIPKGFEQYLV